MLFYVPAPIGRLAILPMTFVMGVCPKLQSLKIVRRVQPSPIEKHLSTAQGLRGERLVRFQHSRDAGASMQFGQNGLGSVVIGFARI